MILDLTKARDPIDRAQLHAMLDNLLDLREQTAADRIPDPAGKDDAAFFAVRVAETIAINAAGWAYNHKIGQALAASDVECNSQDNEKLGEQADEFSDDPRRARKMIVAVLEYTNLLPLHVRMGFIEALRALDFGEVMPLLAPTKNGEHGLAYTLANLRMQAIEYVYYLNGAGTKLYFAREQVRHELGVSESTLRAWRGRLLPKFFGEGGVAEKCNRAKEVGHLCQSLKRDVQRRERILKSPGSIDWIMFCEGRDWENFDIGDLARRHTEAQRL